MSNEPEFTISSGNVFDDLGLPNPDEELLKAQVVQTLDHDGETPDATAGGGHTRSRAVRPGPSVAGAHEMTIRWNACCAASTPFGRM